MVIYVPDHTIKEAGISPQQVQLELAILLYQKEYLSLGQSAHLLGWHRLAFQQELGKRAIPIHHNMEELKEQLDTLKNL